MATFSPSPAPRRSNRLRQSAASPPAAARRIKVTNSHPASRLATPSRAFINDNASVTSGMDIDEGNSDRASGFRGATFFARSSELSVTFYAHLPAEVKQVLKNADFYGDAYTGVIDTLTGFALVASVQTCFVWQHAQALKGTPTCYIFSCPRDDSGLGPPFHVLVPYGSNREPGLILISSSGEIRFWDSIGIGLAGGDHYTTTVFDLTADENITNLIRSDPQTYVATTTTGRHFRLVLTSAGGQHHLTSHPFARPAPSMSLSRLIPSIFSSAPSYSSSGIAPEPGNINAVAIGEKNLTGGREVWTLVDTRVQKWDMKAEGWEEILLDEELADIVRVAIRDAFQNVPEDNASLDLELLDVAIDGQGVLVILVSYAGIEDTFMSIDMSGIRRIYALIRLAYAAETFKVESVTSVPYQSTSSSGAPMHPRIQLILKGALVSVQFGDAVALCARDSGYQNRLELKSATDRTLGVGIIETDSSLLVLTAATMMKAYIDIDKVRDFDAETGRAGLIKSIMTQAILYGSYAENPLHFSFPPEIDEESLMQGAEQLSHAVLESDPEVVHRNHDLTAQLTGRKERLSWLIRFINDNAVLNKMSQRSRQKLATDAEKLYACHQLWITHNDFLATAPTHSVLVDAVDEYMNESNEGHHEDLMRAFFRLHVQDIGKLIRKVMDITIHGQHNLATSLPEANRIILTVLKSAFDYREYNLGVYGVDLPMIKPWTSKPAVIDIVLGLFDSTTGVVENPVSGSGGQQRGEGVSSYLPELVAVLFACIREQLDWLGSVVAAGEAGVDTDRDELGKRFTLLRPEVLETLRRNGHAEQAFRLAEQYRDFSSLAALCHRDTVFPPYQNPHAVRIQTYIDKFKDEFTTELYRWCIQHGELRVMFGQEDTYSGYIDRFFAKYPHPALSWIHDIDKGKHGAAAEALLLESQSATKLDTKHFMLSVGKLAHLAQLQETEASLDETLLDAFHDDLDFVSVLEALLEEFKSVLGPKQSRQSIDSKIDAIVKAKAARLSDRSAFQHVFKELIRELLQGKSISMEDAVDILTLKDNVDTIGDYSTALHLLARVKNLPEARKLSAFHTVWRRIYNHDDWDAIRRTANVTDSQLNDRFQRTALYSVLCVVLPKQYLPTGFDTTPGLAQIIPTIPEITSRWPGMSPDQVEAIIQDYQLESETLASLDLNDVYYRVRELAAHDVVWSDGL